MVVMLKLSHANVDTGALETLVIKLAARIKSQQPWPEQPAVYTVGSFRLYVDTTKEKGFRRVIVTTPEAPALRVTLVDANLEKVRGAERKVMVYLKEGAAPERVGQVRFGVARPVLVMFQEKPKDAGAAQTIEGSVA
jgi:hypothetical protein